MNTRQHLSQDSHLPKKVSNMSKINLFPVDTTRENTGQNVMFLLCANTKSINSHTWDTK